MRNHTVKYPTVIASASSAKVAGLLLILAFAIFPGSAATQEPEFNLIGDRFTLAAHEVGPDHMLKRLQTRWASSQDAELRYPDDSQPQSLEVLARVPGRSFRRRAPIFPANGILVQPGIYQLSGIDPTLSVRDLAPLRRIIGDAEVVALGESVHTSGGYYKAKHRVFQYLVEELGFRAFAFESPWANAEQVAEYVQTCQGSGYAQVSNGLFGVWASREVVDLVQWMCDYNGANPNDPVKFWGFDIQQPWHDWPMLRFFVQRAIANNAAFITGIERCNGIGYGSADRYYADPESSNITLADYDACLSSLASLESYFDDHEAELVSNTSAEDLVWARINLVGLRAWEGQMYFYEDDIDSSYQARDVGMAYVFQAIKSLRNPDEKVAIWAHNWHIAYDTSKWDADFYPVPNMGSHLRTALGDDYFALGLIGYSVSINWPGVSVGELDPPSDTNAVEYLLHHEIARDYLLLDLSFPNTDEPFLEPGRSYSLNGSAMVPGEQFGALLYLDVSPMMNAIGW
ncbi:MAG: erythromycin esterase family protein [bacterium]|nr:erythromycin esterase family protein [bacterium]